MSIDSRAARLENRNRLSKDSKSDRRDLNRRTQTTSLDTLEPSPNLPVLKDTTLPESSSASSPPSLHNTPIEPSLMAASSATVQVGSRDLAMPEDSAIPTVEGDTSTIRATTGRKDRGGDGAVAYDRTYADRDARSRRDDSLTYTKTE
ncbi:MAG: hypothetical protein M1824_004811 [Vezdaea acicularis]|nr:MAG: hypothetical protein M1824_004811 [Vezdaea acicularis]